MNGAEWTLGAWLAEWYRIYKEPNLSAYSLRNIEQMIRLHIPDSIKNMKLSELTAFEIEKELVGLGRTRTAVYARQVLFSALSKAARLGFISHNVMEGVEKIRTYRHTRRRNNTLSEATRQGVNAYRAGRISARAGKEPL